MNAYQLARLVEWADTLKTRKRLQKVVYFLQQAKCPIDAEYTLHLYGPYSADVAQRTDMMVQAQLLKEEEIPNSIAGRSFSYKLSDLARQQLDRIGLDSVKQQRHAEFNRFESLARQLLEEPDLQKLEFAATIAYFRNHVADGAWQAAREAAATFKRQQPDGQVMRDAEIFARQVLDPQETG